LLPAIEPHIDRDETGKPVRVWLSAATGLGLDLLNQALTELFSASLIMRRCFLTPQQSDIRAKLFICAKLLTSILMSKVRVSYLLRWILNIWVY